MAHRRRARGEGTVLWDADRDRWRGRVYLDGKRHTVSAKTKEEAARKLGAVIHGDPAERRADKRATVKRILTDWSAAALPNRKLAPATRDGYAWAVDAWIEVLGRRVAGDLTVEDVERALSRLQRKRALSKASMVKLRSVLSQAMTWAVRRRTIAKNPVDGCEVPRTSTALRELRTLSQAELRAILDELVGHPRRAMYVLMATVGLRPGEASALCADAVDLAAGTITVRRAVQLHQGRPVLSDHLKTKAAHRTIALQVETIEALKETCGAGLLFTAEDGGPLWPSTVRAELNGIAERAGIGPVKPNELRHTAATLMANQLPLHQVADVLGHTSTKMLEATYRHRPAVVPSVDVLA